MLPTEKLPLPKEIILPMSQHVGAPCVPCVAKGDHVDVGTMVGKAPTAVSMHIYSSVSGTVKAVEPLYQNAKGVTVVRVEPDGEQTVDPSIKPPVVTDYQSFIDALTISGIVGLGGAGFPTDIKVSPGNLPEIETILINGAECEPYLTTDNREFLEHPDTILAGINAIFKYLGVPKCIICIEENKPQAIALMKEKTKDDDRISVCELESRYPQGAETIMIRNATGKIVERGKLPASVGCIVVNVTTVSSIGKFLQTGMPLVSKRLTVAGDAIKNPKNLEVPIGTKIEDILEYCGLSKEPRKILLGGPMMGGAQVDITFPIIRQNNGLLAFGEEAAKVPRTTRCVRCGRCVNSCPLGLSPVDIRRAYMTYDAPKLNNLMADMCIGCGCCSYVCPAKLPLSQTASLAKAYLRSKGGK
ncbi:MAG: electron transport complex subunit RsxC [Lachnospiraceae bacterium]|nr:electron transport complex subunit RsxC [Candidatus Equihabitans merdae]